MKRLIIVCEGPTEQEFCRNVIAPEFLKHNMTIDTPTIKRSKGGIVSWDTLKKQIEGHLHESGAIVTTFIDYYGIKDSYGFPGWDEAKMIRNKEERLTFIQQRMKEEFPSDMRTNFIPHLQLHEYESLLFSDISVFAKTYGSKAVDEKKLNEALRSCLTPEGINNGASTAPSKRIESAVPCYEKVLDGSFLAMEIGLKTMRTKCPFFNAWIVELESI